MQRFNFYYAFELVGLQKEGKQATELAAYIARHVLDDNFVKNDDTAWAYAKVLSYLEDGWESMWKYSRRHKFLTEANFSKDWVEQIANRMVSGKRVDTVGEGDWPTQYDLAAFVFHQAFIAPSEVSHAA